MSEKPDLWREAREGYEAAAGALLRNLNGVIADASAPPYVHTFALPCEYMTADEIAAQISAERDVHVDCVHAVLEHLAEWWGADVNQLVRFETPPSYTVEETGHLPNVGFFGDLANACQDHAAEMFPGWFPGYRSSPATRPEAACYRANGGFMVHVKPGCRCKEKP